MTLSEILDARRRGEDPVESERGWSSDSKFWRHSQGGVERGRGDKGFQQEEYKNRRCNNEK